MQSIHSFAVADVIFHVLYLQQEEPVYLSSKLLNLQCCAQVKNSLEIALRMSQEPPQEYCIICSSGAVLML